MECTRVSIQFRRFGDGAYAGLPRDEVVRLAGELHQWLYEPGDATTADPEPIYTALVRRLVAKEVARVLPLHQPPQAELRCDYDCSHCEGDDDEEDAPRYATNTGLSLCARGTCPGVGQHLEHDEGPGCSGCTPLGCTDPQHGPVIDPEPHDVGIVDEPPYDPSIYDPVASASKPRLMTEVLPLRKAKCGECAHVRGEHMGGMCWGPECGCTSFTSTS